MSVYRRKPRLVRLRKLAALPEWKRQEKNRARRRRLYREWYYVPPREIHLHGVIANCSYEQPKEWKHVPLAWFRRWAKAREEAF